MKVDQETLGAIPLAAGVGIFFCTDPGCRRPHVMLVDKEEKPIAHFVVPDHEPDGRGFMFQLAALMEKSAIERDMP